MRLFAARPAPEPPSPTPSAPAHDALVCLQCGMIAGDGSAFCRRCGLPIGAAPRETATLPTCPICYVEAGPDGRIPSPRFERGRLDLVAHMSEHDEFPVGDDDFLETMRVGDQILIGRWRAPFDLVRRDLVTGAIDGGRRRAWQHSAIVTAMSQIKRWGPDAEIFGDQAEWKAAREAVSGLMERYHRSTIRPV